MDPDVRLPLSLTSSAVLLDGDFSPPDFVVRPFFPRGELTEIVGAHGVFKSTLALGLCLSVATGRPWAGFPTRKGRSVFITLEDPTATLARRTRAWFRGIYEPSEIAAAERDVLANCSFLARQHAQPLVLTATREGATSARMDVAKHVARLTDGAELVVLETASRLHDGPETNDGFAALIRSLEEIMANGAALVLVRHMAKKAAREMTADSHDSYAGRGGGALSDAVRSSLIVTRPRGDPLAPITLTLAKSTHAAAGESVAFRPVVEEGIGAVRLEVESPDIQASREATQLLAWLNFAAEAGITRTELHHKHAAAGLTRTAAQRAMANLIARGIVVARQEQRGRTRQPATVYFVNRPGREVA